MMKLNNSIRFAGNYIENIMDKDLKIGLVSVIIPTFNRYKELNRAINSVLKQTYQDFEIIVVDDGSEENIESVCLDFNDNRIRYFRNKIHSNANVARNIGTQNAKGEFIAMLDSDDEFLPNHLERRIEKIKEWQCDGIYGSAYIKRGENEELIIAHNKPDYITNVDFFFNIGFSPTPSLFYKKEITKSITWDENLIRHQDVDFKIEFSKLFILKADSEPTIRINWNNQPGQIYNPDIYLACIKKHRKGISDETYSQYTYGMFLLAKNTNKVTADYFKKESKKITNHYSLKQYLQLFPKANRITRYYAYFEFGVLNIFQAFKTHLNNILRKK